MQIAIQASNKLYWSFLFDQLQRIVTEVRDNTTELQLKVMESTAKKFIDPQGNFGWKPNHPLLVNKEQKKTQDLGAYYFAPLKITPSGKVPTMSTKQEDNETTEKTVRILDTQRNNGVWYALIAAAVMITGMVLVYLDRGRTAPAQQPTHTSVTIDGGLATNPVIEIDAGTEAVKMEEKKEEQKPPATADAGSEVLTSEAKPVLIDPETVAGIEYTMEDDGDEGPSLLMRACAPKMTWWKTKKLTNGNELRLAMRLNNVKSIEKLPFSGKIMLPCLPSKQNIAWARCQIKKDKAEKAGGDKQVCRESYEK